MPNIYKDIVLGNTVFLIAGRVLVKIGLYLLLRHGIVLRNLGEVAQPRIVQVQEPGIVVVSGSPAQHCRHQSVSAVKPGAFRGLGQVFRQSIHLFPVFRRHFHAVLFRLSSHGLVALPAQQRLVQEILLPGLALHSRTKLGVQSLGIVQAEVGKIVAVLGKEFPHLHPIVDLELAHRQFVLSGSRHHGIPGSDYIHIRGSVAALAGNVIGIAVGRDGIFHRFLRGFGLQGFRRRGCFRFIGNRPGIFSVKAADYYGDKSRHKHHHESHRQGDLSGGRLHARFDFRRRCVRSLFLFFLRVLPGRFAVCFGSFSGSFGFPGGFPFSGRFPFPGRRFLRLLRSTAHLRPGVLCLGRSLLSRNLRGHFTGILFLFVHKKPLSP